ncbi:MAG TPA: energy transducer TonB [Candidatus Angelobacter sp.]
MLVLCTLAVLPQANAYQKPGQVEINEAGRKIKKRVPPQYPELALRLRIQGAARVEFTVTPEGAVKDVHELGGHPLLVDALVQAVKQWKYEPAAKETLVEVKAMFSRSD